MKRWVLLSCLLLTALTFWVLGFFEGMMVLKKDSAICEPGLRLNMHLPWVRLRNSFCLILFIRSLIRDWAPSIPSISEY